MSSLLGLAGEDDTVVLGLEPLHGVLLGQTVGEANLADLNIGIDNKGMGRRVRKMLNAIRDSPIATKRH